MHDLRRRLSGDRGPERLQKLAERVPGFAGYARKEVRRDTDRLLRAHIADRLQEQRRKLEDIQAGLVDANLLRELPAVEAAVVRLRTLADEIRTASYGYAGWFDVGTVEEAELDALYDYDLALAEGVDWVAKNVERLSTVVAKEGRQDFQVAVADLNATIDRLAERVVRRREVVVEARRPAAMPSPRQLLAAARAAIRPTPKLPALRPGDALSHAGVDYLVAGRVDYRRQDKTWQAYLLENGEERWLWVVDGGKGAYLLTPVPPPEDLEGKTTIDWQGEEMTSEEAGVAVADIESSTGRQSGLTANYWRFSSTTGRLLWIERWNGEMAAYFGENVAPEDIEVWQRPKSR